MNFRYASMLAAVAAVVSSAAASKVHPSVHRKLQDGSRVNLIIELGNGNVDTLESVKEAAFPSREAKVNALTAKLQRAHASDAAAVTKVLAQESGSVSPLFTDFTSFWISNEVFIEGATWELLEKLTALPTVSSIREEVVAVASRAAVESDLKEAVEAPKEWNIAKIGADKVWADGNIGQGVLVASIGSGVRHTHEALARNFIGEERGWYDPAANTTTPYDVSGYGTHAMGVIAGSQGVGVAPGASWMTCKGCLDTTCPEALLVKCSQWILCPPVVVPVVNNSGGSNSTNSSSGSNSTAAPTPLPTSSGSAKCGEIPRVVHNAWFSYQGDKFFQPQINAWALAGIVGVFQAGDAGPQCGSVVSPGDSYNSLSVGSVSSTNTLSAFSGKGPSPDRVIKPDLLAPGSRVRSATNTGDAEYMSTSGTATAAAHVVGTIALMLAANPALDFARVRSQLLLTTDQKGIQQQIGSNITCNTPSNVWPNNQFGNGVVNAFNAYEGYRP